MTEGLIHLGGPPADRDQELRRQFQTLVSNQTLHRQGNTVPLHCLRPDLESPERRRRERAWRQESRRRLQDASTLSEVWDSLVRIRTELRSDAGTQTYLVPRADEVAELSLGHEARRRAQIAVEEFVTSVLVRLHERRRLQLGLRTIRPWDLYVAPPGFPVGPVFGTKGEAVAAIGRALADVPYDAVHLLNTPTGASDPLRSDEEVERFLADVGVALAQGGVSDQALQGRYPGDVAAVALPLLVLHGTADVVEGQTAANALRRTHIRQLESYLLRWTFFAMIDAFEEWAYKGAVQARDEDAAGAFWSSLWLRFLPAVDWAGLEEELRVEWQRHEALFLNPGDSVPRMWREMQIVRSWSLVVDHRRWFQELGVFVQQATGPMLDVAPITEQDVLDVARWIEDAIEEQETSC
jgi:oligoendopeptidase F